ncbi:MAG: oligoendopeptidase F [candidate division Zixibacteria bacterium]|nr:oligoendopeptidase F [candidate division Zixibacteria bacterium]
MDYRFKKLFSWFFFLLLSFHFTNLYAQSETKAIPQRADIADKYKWSLEDIYPAAGDWEHDFTNLQGLIPKLSEYKGHLAESGKKLLECLALNDSLSVKMGKLYVYAYMKLDEDTRVSNSQQMADRVSSLNTQLDEATSFIQPEILTIPDEKIKSFIQTEKGLSIYQFYFEDLLRTKAHILSPEEERILALAGDLAQGPLKIFSMIDDADIKYPSIKGEKGEEVQLTKERYSRFLESTNRRVRRDASQAYNSTYLKYLNTLGATLTTQLNRDIFFARARKYKSCLEASLDKGNIPVSVYENLIQAVSNNLEPLHRYISLRKKVLKVDTLYTYDLYVPLVPEAKIEISYDSALVIIQKALAPLGKEYLKDLKKGFDSRWIDVYETEGKTSSAYSWGAYATHPYVLLNYNNTLENMFTVAHEMGHCLHRYYTNKNEPYVYGGHTLFTAEVASTINETLLMQYMINNAKDKSQKLYLLEYYIQQIMGTFYLQTLLADFEKIAHEKIEKGEALSAGAVRKSYREILQKYYGPELYRDSISDLGALRLYHFYRNFYVYQYATSYTASTYLSTEIYEGNKEALARYHNFLKIGTSDYPISILKKAGVDMSTFEPMDKTIELFNSLVDQLEKLLLKE